MGMDTLLNPPDRYSRNEFIPPKLDGRTLAVLMHAAQVLYADPNTQYISVDKNELKSAIMNAKHMLEHVQYEVVK